MPTLSAVLAQQGPVPLGRRARVEGAPDDVQRVRAALDRLHATAAGAEVAAFLDRGDVTIRVLDDMAFEEKYPVGAGAVYDQRIDRMVMRSSSTHSLGYSTTILAHEGKHAMDDDAAIPWFLDTYVGVATGVDDAVRAGARLDNPMTAWVDTIEQRWHDKEVPAYIVQAQVAREIGRNEHPWGLGQARDGSVRTAAEIDATLEAQDLYQLSTGQRLLFGSVMGALPVLGGAWLTQRAAQLVRPGSYLARHQWPVVAAGGVALGAALLHDQLVERRGPGSATAGA